MNIRLPKFTNGVPAYDEFTEFAKKVKEFKDSGTEEFFEDLAESEKQRSENADAQEERVNGTLHTLIRYSLASAGLIAVYAKLMASVSGWMLALALSPFVAVIIVALYMLQPRSVRDDEWLGDDHFNYRKVLFLNAKYRAAFRTHVVKWLSELLIVPLVLFVLGMGLIVFVVGTEIGGESKEEGPPKQNIEVSVGTDGINRAIQSNQDLIRTAIDRLEKIEERTAALATEIDALKSNHQSSVDAISKELKQLQDAVHTPQTNVPKQ
ncbi:hypothetical protein [Thalassoroseus pseudoceratinae]|uniref:hypothetical protein n=1 Tax=Thalassoroseus pseudoceratinae TaxID=2713176 RepID=UPI00142288A0|nr:hypothetical protein [Thalassoroseus pseudoceratinae]